MRVGLKMDHVSSELARVVRGGICTGCGACVACAPKAAMVPTLRGPIPSWSQDGIFPELALQACSGRGIDYPELYNRHYGRLPEDWRVGIVDKMWTGFAAHPEIRRIGASGGVTSRVLIFLVEAGLVDAVIVAKQGAPKPEEASWFIARTRQEILNCAQSVYIPVSMLDVLPRLEPGKRYAMTCVPEQSASLRVLQHAGHEKANHIKYVLGPYTGTALYPAAIRTLLRSKGVRDDDAITSLKWRAGEWPGYLQILTKSGREIRSKKVYYNFLIPFFVTQTSLQSMDFANEFCDLSVGDAWSPKFESLGAGFSVIASRSQEMTCIVEEMADKGLLEVTEVDPLETSAMHGHMIDFKKRGGYLRNQWRRMTGRIAANYGLTPQPLDTTRILVEIVISSIFIICRTYPARKALEWIPESILGPLFNWPRLGWKAASKPAKRKGLGALRMLVAKR